MKIFRLTVYALSIVVASCAFAAAPELERLLLPITVQDVPGAFGTHWSSELWLKRSNFAGGFVGPICDHICSDPFVILVDPYHSFPNGFFRTEPGDSGGSFLYIEKQYLNTVSVSLRLSETSGRLRTIPLQLPVVKASDFSADAVHILGVPKDSTTRLMLRVYGSDPDAVGNVRVRIYAEDGGSTQPLVRDLFVPLAVVQRTRVFAGVPLKLRPPMAQVDLGSLIPAATHLVRLEITSVTPDLAIWAFVSITDNETQAVALRTPN